MSPGNWKVALHIPVILQINIYLLNIINNDFIYVLISITYFHCHFKTNSD